MKRRSVFRLRWLVASLLLATGLWHQFKPVPAGMDLRAPLRPAQQVTFLHDITYIDDRGERVHEQEIFDRVIALIHQARRQIVVDMFLFNDFAGEAESHRPLAQDLTAALLAARAHHPDMPITVITDPFNTLYGGIENRFLDTLREAGAQVVMTDLDALRDSNPLWSSIWRVCCQWFGNSSDHGWLPNPVGSEPVSLRSWLALPNFKANHRKTLVVDSGDGWTALVTSANPHTASSAHDNIALEFNGAAALDVLVSEAAVMRAAGIDPQWPQAPAPQITDAATLQVLTESAIRERALELLARARKGDDVRLSMFYFSHRDLARALVAARQRGATVRVLLDPNEHAFGRHKNGVPNRPLAADLVQAGVPVRWCDTHGEQCHSKVLQIDRRDGTSDLLLGSANYTRRNLDNYNLETNVLFQSETDHPAQAKARALFQRQWQNLDGMHYSAPYARYRDHGRWHYLLYRLMEATGLSSF